jgi:hypothetical protein
MVERKGGGGRSQEYQGAGDGMCFGRREVGCWRDGCERPSLSASAFRAGTLGGRVGKNGREEREMDEQMDG